MQKYSNELKDKIRNEYRGGQSIVSLAAKYNINYSTIKNWVKHLPDNHTGRFYQEYKICNDYAEIYIKYQNSYVKALIDIEDMKKCQELGIWSLTKAGYVINYKTGIYLHRFVMNCPKGTEVDHIFHDLLDNRKSMLRYATSSEQKMNTKLRKDNRSGHRGVHYDSSRNKWAVYIKSGNQRVAKRFDTYEEACNYCDEKQKQLHKEFKYKEKCDENIRC